MIIGAHYDTVTGTSGVSVLLELARLHAEIRFLKLCASSRFTLEEPPSVRSRQMGSRIYARSLKERAEQVDVMLCLEMVGSYSQEEGSQSFPLFWMRWRYPATGNFITVVGNSASESL